MENVMRVESLFLRLSLLAAVASLLGSLTGSVAATSVDKDSVAITITGCLGETTTEGAHSLVDDEGQEFLVRAEQLSDYIGHRLVLEGVWKKDGDERFFAVISFETLGACAGEESIRIQ